MQPNQMNDADAKLIRMLQALSALDEQEAPRHHSQRTPQCPSLARFKDAMQSQKWTAQERQHVYESGCVYCGKILRLCSSGHTVVGGTILAQSLETWPILKERLKPWLPALLSLAGVNPDDGDKFLDFIEKNRLIPIGKDEHLRQVLPGWLKKFANTTLDELSEANLKWMALRVVAGREAAGESPEAQKARETLLASREVVTRQDVKQMTQTGAMPRLPDAYWIMFFSEVRREEYALAGLL